NEVMSEHLWSQLKQHLTREMIQFPKVSQLDDCANDDGDIWVPFAVNPTFQLQTNKQTNKKKSVRLQCALQLKKKDGKVDTPNLQSMYIIMIYLNEDFEGGSTRLWNNHQHPIFCTNDAFHSFRDVKSITGTCVIFHHNGSKYVLKGTLMFERVNKDSTEERPLQLLRSMIGTTEEDPKECIQGYIKTLQLQQVKIDVPPTVGEEMEWLPLDIYLLICSYLTRGQMIKSFYSVCRAWKLAAQSPLLWRDQFKIEWPDMYPLERRQFLRSISSLHTPFRATPWFHLFRLRAISDQNFQVVTIHIQTHHVEYGMSPKTILSRRKQDLANNMPKFLQQSLMFVERGKGEIEKDDFIDSKK
ncbi:hypothetical protein RFI_32278, partial [Reticulomyxa filosa]